LQHTAAAARRRALRQGHAQPAAHERGEFRASGVWVLMVRMCVMVHLAGTILRFLAGLSTHACLRLAQFAQAQAPGAATVPPDVVQDVMRTQRTAWEDGIIRAVDDASMAGNARTMVCACPNIRGKGSCYIPGDAGRSHCTRHRLFLDDLMKHEFLGLESACESTVCIVELSVRHPSV
jgi:hypothetical protein